MGYNNFENKMRRDGRIWGSVYRFLVKQAGLQAWPVMRRPFILSPWPAAWPGCSSSC